MLVPRGPLRMSRIIRLPSLGNKNGFTLFEALTASVITLFIIMGVWSIYVLGWSQWHEIAPQLDAQKIVRSAIVSIIDGARDSSAGTYSIGSSSYYRRNGIAQAVAEPDISSANTQRIDFKLEPDTGNSRSFYLGADPASGMNAVYYRDNSGNARMLKTTIGITDLQFEKYGGLNNLVKVTASVERDVVGTRQNAYHIKVVYSDVAYLRSVSGT